MARHDTAAIKQKIATLKQAGRLPKRRAKWAEPVGIIAQEREYTRDLEKFTRDLKLVTESILIAALPRIEAQRNRELPVVNKDAYGDEVEELIAAMRREMGRRWTKKELEEIARRRGISVAKVNKMNLERNWKRVAGIDLVVAEPWIGEYIGAFAINNASLIRSVETKYLDEISQLVMQGFQAGLRWETISGQIFERFDVSESRADLIARDQVSKLQGGLTELRQTELGITKYTWRTMGDERVRETHRAHDGNVYSWDDPPSDTGHPGQDYNCRCYASPLLDDFLE